MMSTPMKKGNILDIAFKAVRDSNKTNTWDRKSVQYWAYHMGFFEFVTWIECNKSDYISYINSIDFDKVPDADVTTLLEIGDPVQAREELEYDFEEVMEEYRNGKHGFFEMLQLPFDFHYFTESKTRVMSDFINENLNDHAMNYFLHIGNTEIFWFLDYFYMQDGNAEYGYRKVEGSDWARLRTEYDNLSEQGKSKFEIVDEHLRLAALMAES